MFLFILNLVEVKKQFLIVISSCNNCFKKLIPLASKFHYVEQTGGFFEKSFFWKSLSAFYILIEISYVFHILQS